MATNMAEMKKHLSSATSATNIEPTVEFLTQQFDKIVSSGKKIKETDIFHDHQDSFESSDIERTLENYDELKFSKVPVKM